MIAKEYSRSGSSSDPRQLTSIVGQGLLSKLFRVRWLDAGLRGFLAAILVWAGLSKLVDPANFYGAILAYQLPAPHLVLKITTLILPWLELFCGLLLVTNVARQATLLCVNVLFAVFIAVAGQAYLRGLDVSCGCFDLSPFGIPQTSKLGQMLESVGFATLRNVVLLVAAVFLWKTKAQTEAAEN